MGKIVQEFFKVHDKLHRQCSYYCRHLGHLKGLIENDDWMRVVDDSMSGRVLLLGNSEITNALILFNTRMFDRGSDTFTIHKLAQYLPEEEEIEQYHRARMDELGISYELERYYTSRSHFIEARQALRNDGTQVALRSLRDYTLAHNIEPATEPERATLNDLVRLTEAVNELVDLAGNIIVSSNSVYRSFSNRAEQETRMLYAALPRLADAETE